MRKLRQKLERVSPQWRYVHTHFGAGYRFAAEPAEGAAVAPTRADGLAVEPAPADRAAGRGERDHSSERPPPEPARSDLLPSR